MIRRTSFAILPILLFSFLAHHPAPQRMCQGFLPPNDLSIPDSRDARGISRQQFDEVLDLVHAIYKPIFNAQWYTLDIQRFWDNPMVNASASRLGPACIIQLYGGLA